MTVKVLCITGWCRNGSTIVGNILGEVPGLVHIGELHFLWKNAAGYGVNSSCGCGLALTDCPIWAPVLAAGTPTGTSLAEWATTVMRRQQAAVRTRHTWRVLRAGNRGGLQSDDLRGHAELMTTTLRAIIDRTGASVIVDSTKIPGESALLPLLDGVEPYFVHLVRHPAAAAHSWRAPKDYVYAMSAARSTAYWHGFNIAARALTRRYPDRSMLLRYEDFTAEPAAAIDAMLRLCGVETAGNLIHGRTVDLHTNHTVTGNPDRFRTGPTTIRERDDAWRTELRRRDQLTARVLSWPLRRDYGYEYQREPWSAAAAPARVAPAGVEPARVAPAQRRPDAAPARLDSDSVTALHQQQEGSSGSGA